MQSFEQIVRTYGPRLYAHIRRLVVVHDDAEDLLQNVWAKVWQKLPQYRAEAQLYTWLYRIAHNEALDHLRREKRRRNEPLEGPALWLGAVQNTAFAPDTDETVRLLHAALLQLPERQRSVFELRYFEDMTYEQIADILQVSEGALKASYHHAVKKVEQFVQRALNPEVVFASHETDEAAI